MPWEIIDVERDKQGQIVKLKLLEAGKSVPETWPQATRSDIRELYTAHAKEAFDQFRYFGTLRSLVTWGATGVAGIAIARLPAEAFHSLQNIVIVGLVLIVIMVFIFWMQRWLQSQQRLMLLIARRAQSVVTAQSGGELEKFSDVRRAVKDDISKSRKKPPRWVAAPIAAITKGMKWAGLDSASLALLGLFVVLFLAFGAFALTIGWKGDAAPPDKPATRVICEAVLGCPSAGTIGGKTLLAPNPAPK